MTAYIGIDPGLSGAVARISAGGATVCDIPSAVVKATRRDYLAHEFASLVREFAQGGVVAAIEQPFAMPRQASNATLLQGRGYGLAEGILVALGVPYEVVTPQKWRKALGIPPGADKGASRVLASRLFPHLAPQLARVKDDGRAEALLIAEYRRRMG